MIFALLRPTQYTSVRLLCRQLHLIFVRCPTSPECSHPDCKYSVNSDIAEGRLVYWDPINCNHGPGEVAITEAPLCRAHDTDGCRFCRESCEDYEVRAIAPRYLPHRRFIRDTAASVEQLSGIDEICLPLQLFRIYMPSGNKPRFDMFVINSLKAKGGVI